MEEESEETTEEEEDDEMDVHAQCKYYSSSHNDKSNVLCKLKRIQHKPYDVTLLKLALTTRSC